MLKLNCLWESESLKKLLFLEGNKICLCKLTESFILKKTYLAPEQILCIASSAVSLIIEF